MRVYAPLLRSQSRFKQAFTATRVEEELREFLNERRNPALSRRLLQHKNFKSVAITAELRYGSQSRFKQALNATKQKYRLKLAIVRGSQSRFKQAFTATYMLPPKKYKKNFCRNPAHF